MPSLLSEHLRQARHERFVGREASGVGKTALLQEWQYRCANGICDAHAPSEASRAASPTPAGEPVLTHYLDARDVEPTPAVFDRRWSAQVESGGASSTVARVAQ